MLKQTEVTNLIGEEAYSAYRALLLSHKNIKKFSLFKYSSPIPLQKRIEVTEYEETIIAQAIIIRESSMIPFWEAVFAACLKNGKSTQALLKATFFRNGQGTCVDYERGALEGDILFKVTEGDARNVALCSEVLDTDNQSKHFMFLDFHCEVNANNDKIVRSVCLELLPEGFLVLNSGDSYHATSINLMTSEQRINLLGKALLVSPIVDPTYIAHQLQQNSSSIRISRGGKAKQIPKVIDAWSNF